MKFIAGIIAKEKAVNTLVEALKTKLGGFREARSIHVLHASSVTRMKPEMCPREVAILRVSKKKPKGEVLSPALDMTFRVGELYHDLIRNDLLGDFSVGDWECASCKSVRPFCKKPSGKCACGTRDWRYKEIRLTSRTTGISGGIDMLMDFQNGRHTVVEIKSIDKDEYATLVAPLAEHKVRTSLYLRVLEDSTSPYRDRIHHDHARIIYISKGFGKKNDDGEISPFKEFVVDRDDSCTDFYWQKGLAVERHRVSGVIPPGVCTTSFVPRVKQCSCPTLCFSSKYPVGSVIPADT